MWPTELRFLRQPDITQRLIFAQARGQMLRKIPLSQTCGCLRKQSCAYTLTESIEKLIFHSISNLVQIQELKKMSQPYLSWTELLSERVSELHPHKKQNPTWGLCVTRDPPYHRHLQLDLFAPKSHFSALCARSALYTLYSFISQKGSSNNFIPSCYVHYASTWAGKTAHMGNRPLRSRSYQLSSCNIQVTHTPTWRSVKLCLKNSVTSSNRRGKQTYFRDP